MKTPSLFCFLAATLLSSALYAGVTCTANSDKSGGIELMSKPYNFRGKTGTQYLVKDQKKNPYYLTVLAIDGANQVEVILTDLGTNQSAAFDAGFDSAGKIEATLMVRNQLGDDPVHISCQK